MNSASIPASDLIYPMKDIVRIVFLKNIINHPQIIIGDYSYYDDPEGAERFLKNVLYLFEFVKDKLVIGKFCQIATGVRFLMGGSSHAMNGISTYPFKIFGRAWKDASLDVTLKGDTIIGNDVWIGNGATILTGITIGDGAIIGTNALVTKNVDPYTIVGGNPAQVIRKRFDDETIAFLLQLKWWDWPVEKITQHLDAITNADLKTLREIHAQK